MNGTTVPSMRVRPIQLADEAAAIDDLVGRATDATGLGTLSESQALGIRAGTALGFVGEGANGVTGYAGLVPASEPGEWAMEIVADEEGLDLVPELVSSVLTAVGKVGAGGLRWWVYGGQAGDLPTRFGFEPERVLLQMARQLPHEEPPQFGSNIVVAAFRPGIDEAAWLEVNNAAFAGHPENGRWAHRDLEERMATEWFSSEGFRLAWSGSDLVGFCWTKIHPNNDGEIYVIAVAPAHAGKGLGRELALEGMRHLTEFGCGRVFLYTEADNERAVNLYDRLGFKVQQEHRSFKLTVARV